MKTSFILPKIFNSAKKKLCNKFSLLDRAIIEDSVQYASIEYWSQQVYKSIGSDEEAFRWFFKVANNYLLKEIERAKRFVPFSKIMEMQFSCDFEKMYIQIDLCNFLLNKLPASNQDILIKRGMGYTLRELAKTEQITLNAMKQRHSRACRKLTRYFETSYIN